MTVSRQDLQTNMAQSLKLIGEFCTTAPIGELHQKEQAEFESILPTTWQALNDLGHIRLLNTWHFSDHAVRLDRGAQSHGRIMQRTNEEGSRLTLWRFEKPTKRPS